MSSFLVFSGYFFNVESSWMKMKNNYRFLLIPYIMFEFIYLIGIGLIGTKMGASNTFDLSLSSLVDSICFKPIGCYWYLHTLVICMSVYYFTGKINKFSSYNKLLISSVILFGLSTAIKGFDFGNALFFLLGAFIKLQKKTISEFIMPSLLSILLFLLVAFNAEVLQRYSLTGVGMTFFAISFFISVYNLDFKMLNNVFVWIGLNSFSIVLFSPFFTVVSSYFSLFFNFQGGVLCWVLIFVPLVIFGCIAVAFLFDKLHVSKYLMGRNIYTPLNCN